MEKNQIVYDDFAKVEMRVGKICDALDFPKARNPSYKIQVDFGALGKKWSSAQITNYSKEELIGQTVVCTVNMPPRNIAGFMSEVLIMGAANNEGNVILLSPLTSVPLGAEIY